MTPEMNVAQIERWASALSGAAITVMALKRLKEEPSAGGAALAAAGGALIYRGATGFCPVYAAAGINTAGDRHDTREALGGSAGARVVEAITINRPAIELYSYWRRLVDLPRFMDHLVAIRAIDARRSHWVAKAPAGRTVEWEAEIFNEIPGELIAWRTRPGFAVMSAGSVSFKPAPSGRATEVKINLQYRPPAGKVGATVAWLLGYDPSQTIHEDLRRFKQLMETGELATTQGQPRGAR
jgi:uncharacterized membrane protein